MNLHNTEMSVADKMLQRCLVAGLFGLAVGLFCLGVVFYA